MKIHEAGITFIQATKALGQFANLFIRKDKMSEKKICDTCKHCSETKTWCNHYDYEVDYDHTCIAWEGIMLEPVRMTEKELITKYEDYPDSLSNYGNFKQGFILAGGQIIEEPKNLPCVNCGSDPLKTVEGNNLYCSNGKGNCFLFGVLIPVEVWNDPSKRGGK